MDQQTEWGDIKNPENQNIGQAIYDVKGDVDKLKKRLTNKTGNRDLNIKPMKKISILALVLLLSACSEAEKTTSAPPPLVPVVVTQPQRFKAVTYYKRIKELKEIQETQTTYHYKYDWWNNKLRQQPNVTSHSKYFIIYDDHTHDEVMQSEWLNYSKGDSVAFTQQVPI